MPIGPPCGREKRTKSPAAPPGPWSSEDLPFLLLELGRIEYDGFQPEKSPVNPQFRPKTRIVSKCRILYDKLKNATCEERISARDLR